MTDNDIKISESEEQSPDLSHEDESKSEDAPMSDLVKNIKISEIPQEKIDLNALWVVRRLRAKGHEAYLTGGCVRDLLLGRSPKDFDVATSAQPQEVKNLFRNCRLIGRRFLLAHVMFPGGKIIETATFRSRPTLEDEEDQENLLVMQDNEFGTMKEDAFRRDLSINGLFYDPVEAKVIDYVGGIQDLEDGIVRLIGDPEIRLQEDPVRILRSIRFAKRLGFRIEEKTLKAMARFSKDIIKCAPARLHEEILRLMTSGHAKECLELCLEIGILDVLMPELLQGMGLSHEIPEEEGSDSPQVFAEDKQETLDYWYALLGALDKVFQKDCTIASAVAFTILLLPAYGRLERSSLNERNWIDRLCVNWSERIRLTRRDQDLIRLLLSAIPLFHISRVHQKSAHYLVRKSWFKEALLAYIIHLQAMDQSFEEVKVWKALAKNADRMYSQDKLGMKPPISRFRKRRPLKRFDNRQFVKRH